jgi:geranylgeranyl pyrophosphate synthase
LELLHTYSLIHDDLPAMDDDDLRRGQPSCHAKFDEATAILAGDALLTLAFEVLAREPEGTRLAARRAAAVVSLARAAGSLGMVGGQAADLENEHLVGDEERLMFTHERKTGALITASLEIGGLLAGLEEPALDQLRRYGTSLGLAFQIVDDILDVVGDAAQLGKSAGKDAAAGKLTYPALLGLEESRRRAELLVDRATGAVRGLGAAEEPLAAIARVVLERSS